MKEQLRKAKRWVALTVVAVGLVSAAPTAASAEEPSYPRQCLSGRVICIDQTARTVDWMVDGEVRARLEGRFGGKGTPTRQGLFKVYRKSEQHVSRLNGTPMPYSLFFDGGQAVHYSSDFARHGYRGASRGCVNTRDVAGMAWLFKTARLGDKVYVYASPGKPAPPPEIRKRAAPAPASDGSADPWRWY